MKFDDFLEDVGGFGRYQIIQTTLAYTLVLPLSFQLYTLPIISSSPDYRCKIVDTQDTYSTTNSTILHMINMTIPKDESGQMSKCSIYEFNHTLNNQSGGVQEKVERTCTEWVFDRSVFRSSIMEDLSLVCDKFLLKSTTEAAYMGGGIVGSALLGWMYDAYGRKLVTLLAILFLGLFGMVSAWISNAYLLIFIRFLMGMGDAITYLGIVYLCIEVVGPDKRSMVNHCIAISYAVAGCILLSFASFVTSWRVLQTIVSSVALIAIPAFWLIEESPRWLLTVGKDEQAEVIMKKMARMNGRRYPEHLIQRIEKEYHDDKSKWTDLFKGIRMIVTTLIQCFNWFAVALIYYGLIMGMDALRTSFFVVLALMCVSEIPGNAISWSLADRIGRKKTYSLMIITASFSLIATVFPVLFGNESHMWVTVALVLLGKCFGAGAYACITLYTPELYPTTMRSTATAIPNIISRIGSFLAPYISDAAFMIHGDMSRVFHLLVFGVCGLIASVINLQLIETMKTQLPDRVAHIQEPILITEADKEIDESTAPHLDAAKNIDETENGPNEKTNV